MALAPPPGLSSQSVLPIGHTAHRHRTQHIFQYTIFIVYMSHGSKLKLKVHTVTSNQDVVPNVSEVEKSGKVVRGCTRMLYKMHKHKMLHMMHKHKMHLHKMLCPMSPK